MKPCKNVRMKQGCSLTLIGAMVAALLLPQGSLAAADTVLPEGTRIDLQLNNRVSTKKNSEGDQFTAVVTEPVCLGDRVIIPKGSVVSGSISRIQRPGRFKGKAVLTLLFQSIGIPGRGQLPIVASLAGMEQGNTAISSEGTIEGESSGGRDIGTVLTPGLAGAGIGTLAGGGRGAGIGAGVGVAIGLATVFTSRGKDIEMRRGSSLSISLDRPLSIPPEGEGSAARR